MKSDFLDAHERHWDDAERLFAAGRFANADHLYGMAAECGLKRLMQAFGMPFDTTKDRPTTPQDRVHANGIWARFESYRCGHVQGTAYALSTSDPFSSWDVSDRYAHQSNFDQARVQVHQAGATAVCELLKKAQREGLLI
ncbi:MAG TPA: hypothetical protein VIP51_04050 [Eoetvoesiella sp.]